jgi:hypothetical protein
MEVFAFGFGEALGDEFPELCRGGVVVEEGVFDAEAPEVDEEEADVGAAIVAETGDEELGEAGGAPGFFDEGFVAGHGGRWWGAEAARESWKT